MEVKGIGQKIPKRDEERKQQTRFETIFDESKKKLDEPMTAPVNSIEKPPDLSLDVSKMPHLANNTQFVVLQKWMDEFYKDLQAKSLGGDMVDDSLHLKLVLYDCLKKLLREIVATGDRIHQANYLQRVHAWFAKRKERSENKSRKEIGLVSENEIPEPKKYLIVEGSSKKLYDDKMRTLHPEIPPPKERLTEFNIKNLAPESKEANTEPVKEEKPVSTESVPPPPLIVQRKGGHEQDEDNKKFLGIEGQSNFLYYKPRDPEEQKVEKMWLAKKNKEIAEKRANEELEKVVTEWGFAKSRLNENVVRKHENVTFGNNFPVRNATRPNTTVINGEKGIDYEKIYNEASSDDGAEDEQQSPRKMQSTDSERKKKPDRKLPQIVDLRGSTVNTTSNVLGQTSPPRTSPPPPPKPAPKTVGKPKTLPKVIPRTQTAISEADKMRVDYIRKMYGHLIGEMKDNMDTAANIFVNGPKGINSLSIYNKFVQRPYTANNPSKLSRDVPITHQGNREQFRVNQMKEINTIKEHLAREEVPCSMQALQRAILAPEDYPAFRMTADNFLKPGSRLIINPFAKKKKKKKASKKKKGKGKGKGKK